MNSSKVLVTGATGVVGRRLVPILLKNGHRVIVLARPSERRQGLERAGATAVDADLFDVPSLRRATEGCDVVVNLATHMPTSSTQMMHLSAWKENDRVRKEGSANLVDAALAEGVTRFVQESFAPVYPDSGDRWIGEETPLKPVRYNRTVLDAERSAERFTKSGGTGVSLRFAWFYGRDSRFLIEAIGQVRHGRAFLPGPPEAFFSAVAHHDAATAASAALEIPAGVYNVVDDEPLTRREYFDWLARALGVPPPKLLPFWAKWMLGSLGDLMARSLRISNAKLKKVSPWRPKYPSVREGWPAVVAAMPRDVTGLAAA
jgi:nucleoside-diphosphate-sugar epimerase